MNVRMHWINYVRNTKIAIQNLQIDMSLNLLPMKTMVTEY